MEYLDELSFYFESRDIALIEKHLKCEKNNFHSYFQQIIQKDNMIEFELGLLNGNFLVDLTLQDHTVNKTVIDLKKVITFFVTEKPDFYQIKIYVTGTPIIYYEASSLKRIIELKKFSQEIEKIIRGSHVDCNNN